jgi:pimeloyl-ACP methyl ester carboxylesterase
MRTLVGDWVGGIEIGTLWVFVKIHFKTGRKVIISIPEKDIYGAVSTHLPVKNSQIHIELPQLDMGFHGQQHDNTISGNFTEAGKKGTFQVFRVVSVDLGVYEEYAGSYELPNKSLVFGQRWGTQVYLDGRRIIEIFPLSENTWFSERGETITFLKNEKGTEIMYKKGNYRFSGTQTTVYKEEDIQFCNEGITLSGTVVLPCSEGLHPAVVLIHGSGAESREGYRFLADHLARHGIAALRYDKRGTGASEGDWHYASLEDLAEDALKGVHVLQNHSNIHPEKVGLLGTSQGGWIAPIAGNSHVQFMILISGAAVSPKNQELYRVRQELYYHRYSPVRVTLHVLIYRLEIFIATLLRFIQKVVPVSKVLPPTLAFALYMDWDFDPVPVLKQVTCPILSIFGELDKLIPVKESVAILKETLADQDCTITVFPKSNHALLISDVGVWSEIPQLVKKEFVPGYYDAISDWILKYTNK